MKRRRDEVAAGMSTSPAALPPGALASVTTPQRPLKKPSLGPDAADVQQNPVVKKALFQAWGVCSV